MRLDKKELYDWLHETEVEYAAMTVYGQRLRLMVRLDGGYMVTLGGREIYQGCNGEQAIDTFNNHIKEAT